MKEELVNNKKIGFIFVNKVNFHIREFLILFYQYFL